MIKFFLSFLAAAGVLPTQLRFRIYIHETADVAEAERYWARVTNSDPQSFYKTALKRHNPKTTRKNVDADYHGCLRIDVMRSRPLEWCMGCLLSSDRFVLGGRVGVT